MNFLTNMVDLYISAIKYFDYNNFYNNFFNSPLYNKLPDEYKNILDKYGYQNFTGNVSQFLSFLNDTDVFLNMLKTQGRFLYGNLNKYLHKNNYDNMVYKGRGGYIDATDCQSFKEFAAISDLDLYSNKSINNFFEKIDNNPVLNKVKNYNLNINQIYKAVLSEEKIPVANKENSIHENFEECSYIINKVKETGVFAKQYGERGNRRFYNRIF